MANLWNLLWSLLGGKKEKDSTNGSGDVAAKNINRVHHRLHDVEIDFLWRLDGKKADDPSVLGWWCAFHGVDREKLLNKLLSGDYLAFAGYRFAVGKATIPVLKEFLRQHGLSLKGNKAQLVDRTIATVDESVCKSYFKEKYYALTPKGVEILRKQAAEAEIEYRKNIELIKNGSYEKLLHKKYPDKNRHYATEDTFMDTIDFIMKNGFEGFDLREEVRKGISAFVAACAVDYSSRGHILCRKDIYDSLRSFGIAPGTLTLPASLRNYAKHTEIEDGDDMLEMTLDEILDVYIQFTINRARAVAELQNYKRQGIKKVKVDCLGLCECGGSSKDKVYSIGKAPLVPFSWNCNCSYSPIIG